MDRLHLINVFVAVVEANGFAGAARKLGTSPSAVTRAIGDLEAHLGASLVTRTTRVIRVTDAGARYAEDCKRLLAGLTEADQIVSGMHSEPRGQLTLTAPAWFGAKFVTPIVTEYLQRYPEISASCWFLDRVVHMIEEGVDVAVRIAALPDSSLQAIRVGKMRVVICAAPEYLQRHGVPKRPVDLKSHSIVAANSVAPGHEWRVWENGGPNTLKFQPRLSTTTNESAVSAAVAGFGLTQQMLYKVADPLREGRLQTVLEDFEPPPMPVTVLHREARNPTLKVRAFLDLAVERLRALPDLH